MGLLGKKKEKCDACNKPFEDHDVLVDHQKRIQYILNKLRKEALSRGLADEFIEEIWTLMIKIYIKYVEKFFDIIHKK